MPRECQVGVPPQCHESAATVPRECRHGATRVPPQCRHSAARVPPQCHESATRVPRECRHSASGIRMYDRHKFVHDENAIIDCCVSITQLLSAATFLFTSGGAMFNSRFESRLKQHSLAKSRSEIFLVKKYLGGSFSMRRSDIQLNRFINRMWYYSATLYSAQLLNLQHESLRNLIILSNQFRIS